MDKIVFLSFFGAAAAALVGGWDGAMTTLAILMFIDFVAGIVLAVWLYSMREEK